jgi:hypothetical protein
MCYTEGTEVRTLKQTHPKGVLSMTEPTNEQASNIVFHEEAYKSYLVVGFTEEEAERMATQPEEANIASIYGSSKRVAILSFAQWAFTREGFDYWNNLCAALIKKEKQKLL